MVATVHCSNSPLPGGVGDTLTDQFGFQVPLCSLADGFDWLQRGVFLRSQLLHPSFLSYDVFIPSIHRINTAGLRRFYSEMMGQMAYVPKFTKVLK